VSFVREKKHGRPLFLKRNVGVKVAARKDEGGDQFRIAKKKKKNHIVGKLYREECKSLGGQVDKLVFCLLCRRQQLGDAHLKVSHLEAFLWV